MLRDLATLRLLRRDAEELCRRAADRECDGFRRAVAEDVGAVDPSSQREIGA